MADFTFATCLPGLEPAVKLDVQRARPELRFAYSRPGLVTFKAAGSIAPDDAPDLTPWQHGNGGPAEDGELVANVIVDIGEPAWLGLHRHDARHLPHPGGAIPVDVPVDAPSRAYAKLEEAIA